MLADSYRTLTFPPLAALPDRAYRGAMRPARRRFLVQATGALALSATRGAHAASPMGQRLFALLDEVDRQDLALDPQAAVLRGQLERAHEFGDYLSDGYFAAAEATLRAQRRAFAAIDRAQLQRGAERVAYDMFDWQTRLALRRYDEGFVRFAQQMPIDHLFGQHVTFAQFSSGNNAPYRTLKDYDDGLARFDGFVTYLHRAIGRMREGMAAGRVLPRAVAARVVAQLDESLATAPQDMAYYAPIRALPAAFATTDRERLANAFDTAIRERLRPALQRLADFMRRDYLPASRLGAPGVGALPGGRAYYDFQLETMTTLPVGADEIHRIGLDEVARIGAQMRRIRRRVGFTGSLQRFFEHLKRDARYKFDSPAALIGAYEAVGRRVETALPRLFARLPQSKLEIRAVPRELESAVSGAYYQVGTPDGSRPGVFYINTGDLPSRTSLRVTALYLHEALPGHHLQGSLALEASELPPLLRHTWNVGYGEGWGLYAEWLGHEMGLYDDPLQHFGALDMEMFRAVRLVADTGLHAKGWSAARTVDYMAAHTSLERRFIAQEVDRYIAWPGQATAYKLGELRLKQLRAQAQRAFGARFDVRAFHARVLDTGAVPLAALQRKIDDWIREDAR
jgi:uncharacterized protein (DUF885 family)